MKIRKIQQRSVYFEMLKFNWMDVDKSSEFYIIENEHNIEGAMALKEEKEYIVIVLLEVRDRSIGKKVGERLISYACKETLKRGHEEMMLIAKTNLIKHYEKLGAELLIGRTMIFKKRELALLGGKYGY